MPRAEGSIVRRLPLFLAALLLAALLGFCVAVLVALGVAVGSMVLAGYGLIEPCLVPS